MRKEFIMRGQVLNFSGYKPGYAYRLVEFDIYPSTNIQGNNIALVGIITAAKTTTAPTDPNFNDEGLIASSFFSQDSAAYPQGIGGKTVINDLFLITQNLILMVQDQDGGDPINWQCRFVSEKMSGPEEAAVNYKQFTISDG